MFELPRILELDNAIEFVNDFLNAEKQENYHFDFGKMGRISPFAMLYLANAILQFRRANKESRFLAFNFNGANCDYPKHMGFFRAFGLKIGNEPGEASGSTTYLPLTILKISEIRREAVSLRMPIGELLEEKALAQSKILTNNQETPLTDILAYSLKEILRNVVEHSESDILAFCAQFWPSYDKVELCILDTGIGIYESIKANPILEIEDNKHAIELSLAPGISGKNYKGIRQRHNDIWQNSGYGLFMVSQLCLYGGSFFVGSNSTGIKLDIENKQEYELSDFNGTIIRVCLKPSEIDTLHNSLAEIRKKASEITKFEDGAIKSASVASQMLYVKFKHRLDTDT